MSGDLASGTIVHHFAGGNMSGPGGVGEGPHHKIGRGWHRAHLCLCPGRPCHARLRDDCGGGRRRRSVSWGGGGTPVGENEEERRRGRRRSITAGRGALAGEKEEHRTVRET